MIDKIFVFVILLINFCTFQSTLFYEVYVSPFYPLTNCTPGTNYLIINGTALEN